MTRLPTSLGCLLVLLAAATGITFAEPPDEPSHTTGATSVPDFDAVVRGIRPRGFGKGTYALLEPAAGSKTYYVAPDGDDGHAGSDATPFRTINHAAQVAAAGDVVTIRPGRYQESVPVRNSGAADKRIVFQAEQRGKVVLTGGRHKFEPAGWTGGKMSQGPLYVTVRGLVFRDYADVNDKSNVHAAAKAATGWTYDDCLFHRAGRTGLDIRGDDVTVRRCTFQENHQHGFTAWGPAGQGRGPDDPTYIGIRNLRIEDVILRGNYTSDEIVSPELSSRVAKILGSRGTVIDNLESTENYGPGLWIDYANFDYTIRNSYFHRNRWKGEGHSMGMGMHLEINWGPALVENNVFLDNEHHALQISNSSGVTVKGNLFVRNHQGIRLLNWTRGEQFPLKDIRMEGNYFHDWAANGAIVTWAGEFTMPEEMGLSADANTYDPKRNDWLVWWTGKGYFTTLDTLRRELGWEQKGQVAPVPLKPPSDGRRDVEE